MDIMKIIKLVACILVVVGAINWGLVGAFNINLVEMLLGAHTMASKVVYILVGLSGLMMLINMKDCHCKKCD